MIRAGKVKELDEGPGFPVGSDHFLQWISHSESWPNHILLSSHVQAILEKVKTVQVGGTLKKEVLLPLPPPKVPVSQLCLKWVTYWLKITIFLLLTVLGWALWFSLREAPAKALSAELGRLKQLDSGASQMSLQSLRTVSPVSWPLEYQNYCVVVQGSKGAWRVRARASIRDKEIEIERSR